MCISSATLEWRASENINAVSSASSLTLVWRFFIKLPLNKMNQPTMLYLWYAFFWIQILLQRLHVTPSSLCVSQPAFKEYFIILASSHLQSQNKLTFCHKLLLMNFKTDPDVNGFWIHCRYHNSKCFIQLLSLAYY